MMRYLLTGLALLTLPALASDYAITRMVPLGAPDRWDYVTLDAPGARAYIAHGDRISIVDTASGKLAGTLMVGGVTHGTLVLPDGSKAYADDGKAGTVAVFDPKSLRIEKTIKAEPDADGIVYDPATGHVLVITGDSGKVVVIDPHSDTVLARIDGGGPLEFGVADGKGSFFVDGEDKNEIVRMDLRTNTATAHWPLTGCKTPHGLAMDRAHRRLFASCGNAVMDVVDADSGAVLASMPIGQGSDFAVFDAHHGWALSSNRDGTLSRIAEQGGKFVALPAIVTQKGARTMALDDKTGRVYLVASDVTADASARGGFKTVPGTARLLYLDPVMP